MIETFFDSRNRRATLAAVVVLFIVCGVLNFYFGNVGLRPVATVCVILFTLYTGLIPGLSAALVATGIYVWIGIEAPSASDASKSPLTSVVFLATNLVCVIVASGLRSRIVENIELQATRARLETSERRYRTVGEFIPFGIWQTDGNDKLVFISQSFLDLVGMTMEEASERGWLDRLPPDDRRRLSESWSSKEAGSGVWECEYRIRGADGKMYSIHSRGTRLIGEKGQAIGWIGVNFDVTAPKRAVDRLGFLAEAGRLLSSSLDPETTLERIAALCVPQLADWVVVELLQEDGSLQSVAIKHVDPAKVELARRLQEDYPPARDSSDSAHRVVTTGQPLLISDISDELLVATARDERHLQILRRLGMTSAMFVPLNARQQRLGVVSFIDAESKRRFDHSDLELATILCARAALAYDNARLFAKEQRVAETFQAASLPTELPQINGIRVSATYRAGGNESEVGGDWYDAFELPDGNLVVSIGDVAGKGLTAAVAMSAVRQLLSAAGFEGAGPADMLRRCNRVICHRGSGIVTAAIGVISPESKTFTYATAGHPPILYADAKGTVASLTTDGIPLGIIPEYTYVEKTVATEEMGVIVLYTDGLTEFNRDIHAGERELRRVVRESVGSSTPNLADAIVRSTVRGKPLDDIAVLAIEMRHEAVDALDISVPAVTSSARVVRRSLRRLCMANGLSEDQMFRVLVAVGEAVSNAIEHAYVSGDGAIRVKGERKDGSLWIEIADDGRWRKGQRYEGGRGILLMQRLMDDVIVDTNARGTAVRQRIAIGEA